MLSLLAGMTAGSQARTTSTLPHVLQSISRDPQIQLGDSWISLLRKPIQHLTFALRNEETKGL